LDARTTKSGKPRRQDALNVVFGATVAEYLVKPRFRRQGIEAALAHVGAVLATDALDHLLVTLPKNSRLETLVAGDDRSELSHVPPGEYLLDEFESQVYIRMAPVVRRGFQGTRLTGVHSLLE
jgi:hypothetical protein